MTIPPKKTDTFELLLESHLSDLLSMTDEEVLDGKDAASIQAQGLRLLDAAKAQAGRQRLAEAKSKVEDLKSHTPATSDKRFSATEARALLRKASNDSRYTLAARGLDEMSDEDVIRLCEQLALLENAQGKTPGG